MKLVISKASDKFRDCELPSPKYPPHKTAFWDRNINNWVVNINSLDQLITLIEKDYVRLIIDKKYVEIDDVTHCIEESKCYSYEG